MTDCKSLKIAYIGGGSMGWARIFMSDLALEPELGGEIRLYDIDMQAAKNNEILGNRISADQKAAGKWRYITALTLEDALTDVDFVVISILPGTFTHMHSDVHLPERLGIYQPVGDTVGPGGIIRSLRTVPHYVRFAEAIRSYAPDAWVINYTNPMSICVRTLYHVFPDIKAFGCCHEVFGTQGLLAAMLEAETGTRPHRSEIKVDVTGINHFTWFTKATYGETDLMATFSRFVDLYHEKGFSLDDPNAPNICFTSNNKVKFDLFKRYGLIASAGDRHLAEFIPGGFYTSDPETIQSWGFHLTSVDWRINDRNKKIEQTNRLVSGEDEIKIEPSGEEGILLIKALCGLTNVTSNVNLPNKWQQIADLPDDIVVETNAVFSTDKVEPAMTGNLPGKIRALIVPHAENQSEILKAALECDRKAVYNAFKCEPMLDGKNTGTQLQTLADDMITNTIDALPDGWK